MNENTDKAIRDADARERAQFWFMRWGVKGVMLCLETLGLGIILYSLWRN